MAPKTRTRFVCQNCGKFSPSFLGRCPACGEFNTMVEEIVDTGRGNGTREMGSRGGSRIVLPSTRPQRLADVNIESSPRLPISIGEFNRVLGGGIVPGSIILLGGDPGIGKCVAAGTLIPTDRGLIPIERLKPDGSGEGFSELHTGVQSTDGLRRTSHFYDSGVQPTRRIQTRMGFALQATYTHPVLTLSPEGAKCWKRMEDVRAGDFVAIQRHGAVWGDVIELPAFEFEARTNAVIPRLPNELDGELAYILGLVIGDGCLNSGHDVQLTTADADIQAAFQRWAASLGLHMGISQKQHTSAVNCRIASRILLRWLEHIGVYLVKAGDKQVPRCVMQSTEANIRAFLQGLFDTDGSSHKLGVEFCTISETLARQVHLLLLQFGIVAKLRFKPDAFVGTWIIHMQGNAARHFYQRIGFRLARKQARQALLPMTSNANVDLVPYLPDADPRQIPHPYRKDRRYLRGERAASYDKLANMTRFIPELADLLEPAFFWDAVVEAADGGMAHCYDLTVPETHAFVANGIVSHNSTLLIQACASMAQTIGRVLYVSGEESAHQIKMRADRMGLKADDLFLITETNVGAIFEHIHQIEPQVVIIDSIQTIYTEESESSPGSVSQVRECASRFQMLAKTSGTSVFLIGHVTKEGNIAGPRVLEHIVDTVLYLEGDPFQSYRLLRSVKNRFGATSEVGVFEMSGMGMLEVPNPSEVFLAERVFNAPGTTIAVTMEGTRPLLVEIQALTSPTSFGNPRRTPNGVDYNRLLLISAVLTKRFGLKLHEHDIFLNVIGGMKIDEPASDLAMAMALASSYYETAVPNDMAFIGEIGLSGELRAVSQMPARIHEAAKLGFKRVMIPKMKRKLGDVPNDVKLVEVRNVGEAIAIAVPKD